MAPGPTETRPDLHTLVKTAEESTDWKTKVFVPPPPPPPTPVESREPEPPPPVPVVISPPPSARPRRRLFLTVGATAAAMVLAGASYLLGAVPRSRLPSPRLRPRGSPRIGRAGPCGESSADLP